MDFFSKKIFFQGVALLSLTALALSCSIEEGERYSQIDTNAFSVRSSSKDIFEKGKRIRDPYSLSIMQEALDSLLSYRRLSPIELVPTNYYIRVRPTDTSEYRALMCMDLDLFDYPLDNDINYVGYSFHDPSIPEGEVSWQYAVVDTGKIANHFSYEAIQRAREINQYIEFQFVDSNLFHGGELIDAIYIPEEDNSRGGGNLPVSPEELEALAISLATGKNFDSMRSISRAKPRGHIYFYDTSDGDNQPISFSAKNVRVRAQHFTKIASSFTDDYGDYIINKFFLGDPKISVQFKNESYKLYGDDNFLTPASYSLGKKGWQDELDYPINYSTNPKLWYWTALNNACYEYYRDCELTGVIPPPNDLKIWCYPASWSSAPMLRRYQLSDVILAGDSDYLIQIVTGGGFIPSTLALSIVNLFKVALPDIFFSVNMNPYYSDVKGTVFHELSHASHFSMAGETIWIKYVRHIVDSWFDNLGCYGTGETGTEGEAICGLGETWGYLNQRLISGGLSGEGEWFDKNIDALYEIVLANNASREEILSQMGTSILDINTLRENLCGLKREKADTILGSFIKYNAIKDYSIWKVRNCTSKYLLLEVFRGGQKVIYKRIFPNNEAQIGKMPGDHYAIYDFRYNQKYMPDSIRIYYQNNGHNVEAFHSKGSRAIKDFTRSFFYDYPWVVECDSSAASGGIKVINTYEIQNSDIN